MGSTHLIQFGLKETFDLVLMRLTDGMELLCLHGQIPVFLLKTKAKAQDFRFKMDKQLTRELLEIKTRVEGPLPSKLILLSLV